jgi:hypothetical protein
MFGKIWLGAVALVAVVSSAGSQVFDYSQYPDLRGQWDRFIVPGLPGQPSFDQTKPWGNGQQAPLTPEYQAILDASIADQEKGGLGNSAEHVLCRGAGMPFMMITDGRDWPTDIEPTIQGYSIGKWIDEDGDGKFDVLEVETRGFKGNRVYDISGIPLHRDNRSVFKERIFLDKTDSGILHDEITVIDNALTRPWTVDKRYVRNADLRAQWPEFICNEDNGQVMIGGEHYYLSGEGFLMPVRKDQPPPDLRYFKQPQR